MVRTDARTKWMVWGTGLFAYMAAMINRGSFSALGAEAQQHYQVEATTLAVFVFLQLAVYAACQIPVGILLDRFGPSVVVTGGMLLMAVGQVFLGTTDSVPLAMLARVLVGAGDSCIFISAIRLVSTWFTFRQIPVLNQSIGLAGQVGQMLAVAPLAALVHAAGWTGGFCTLGALSAAATALVLVVVRDRPGAPNLLGRLLGRGPGTTAEEHHGEAASQSLITDALPVIGPQSTGVLPALRSLLRRPGVRLAFWIHFSTPFALNCFLLLWGNPFLTGGLGYSFGTSATVLSTAVASSMVSALGLGPVLNRYQEHRVRIAWGGALTILLCWAVLLLWPGTAPVWWVVLTAVVMGVGGPLSVIAFDVVRAHAPVRQLGVATGMVNTGGFLAALFTVLATGVVLDLLGAGTPETYAEGPFTVAMAVQVPVWLLGLTMIAVEAPKARQDLEEHRQRAGL